MTRHYDPCGRRNSVVLVVALEPAEVTLVATVRGPIEPLPHRPHGVDTSRIRGIRVVNGAVVERERAHAGTLERQVPRIAHPVLEVTEVVRAAVGDRLCRE